MLALLFWIIAIPIAIFIVAYVTDRSMAYLFRSKPQKPRHKRKEGHVL